MSKLWVVIGILAAALAGVLLWQNAAQRAFDQRATQAEAYAAAQQPIIDSLKLEALRLKAKAGRIDTLRIRARDSVAHVDSIYPPDSSCMPNLAARDHLIAVQAAEIDTLRASNGRWEQAFMRLQASKDTLEKALASRPKRFAPRIRGPSVGPSVWLYPGQIRVGVSFTPVSIGL